MDFKELKSENINYNNNQQSINANEFLEKYKKLIEYINKESIIDDIEDAYKSICFNKFNATSIGKLNNILSRLLKGNMDNLQTFNIFMQNPGINYSNQVTKNSIINAKLKKIRNIYFEFFLSYNAMLSEPFNIRTIASSIQNNSPNVNVIFTRNDGEEFIVTLNFNSLLNITNQLIQVANQKLNKGNNIVDIQLINNFQEASVSMQHSIEKFKVEKKIK